jgi:hypothetical protein
VVAGASVVGSVAVSGATVSAAGASTGASRAATGSSTFVASADMMMVFDERRVSSQRGAVMMMQNLDEGEMDSFFAQDLCMKTDIEWVR